MRGGWNIADAVSRSYDLEGMHVGTVGAGRIGRGDLWYAVGSRTGLRMPSPLIVSLGG
jgi:phosphoglycerate dehydrogenase-like enzyme